MYVSQEYKHLNCSSLLIVDHLVKITQKLFNSEEYISYQPVEMTAEDS